MKEFDHRPQRRGQRWTAGWPDPAPPARSAGPEIHPGQAGEGERQRLQAGRAPAKGDVLQLYINDEFFHQPTPENAFLSVFKPHWTFCTRTSTSCCSTSAPAWWSHPREGAGEYAHHHIQAYLYQKKSGLPTGSTPSLRRSATHRPQHRWDRHRRQDRQALRVMNQKIRDRELQKLYLCVVHGTMAAQETADHKLHFEG